MRHPWEWEEPDVLELIRNRVQESLTLDYKACGALAKTDSKKIELSKDVSAFANSAGGTLIYGLTENNNLPTGIDSEAEFFWLFYKRRAGPSRTFVRLMESRGELDPIQDVAGLHVERGHIISLSSCFQHVAMVDVFSG